MTKKSQLAIEMSEKREKLNGLLGLGEGELTTEQRSEMAVLTDAVAGAGTGADGRDRP